MSERIERREAAGRYVGALFGSVGEGLVIEVRFRVASGMRQRFFATGRLTGVVDAVLVLASRTDVFIGVLPRVRRRGRLEDVAPEAAVLWADCDTDASAAALASFRPSASMVLASGTGQRRHAYSHHEKLKPHANKAVVRAGAKVGVSASTVERVQRVKARSPELHEQIRRGEITSVGAGRSTVRRNRATATDVAYARRPAYVLSSSAGWAA